jgi:DNA-binding transcriptional LysR family regulator
MQIVNNASMRDPINLNRLAYFATVVETGSFTRAAERLGIGKAVVSQQVARLEQEAGATLLLRTTRSVVPTDEGRAFHARCVVILQESAEAFDELAQVAKIPRGTLRVTAPFDYGSSIVVPVATRFTQTFEECDIELSLSDRIVDVQAVDLAIRVGWLRDSSHVTRRIGTMEQYLVCSPDFETKLGRVRAPEDLSRLAFVANGSLPEPNLWRFSHPKRGQRTARMRSRFVVDATPSAHAAALAGAGLSVLPDYLVVPDLVAGRLVRVLPEWKLRSGGIHVVLPSVRFRSAKVSRFLELLSDAETQRRERSAAVSF